MGSGASRRYREASAPTVVAPVAHGVPHRPPQGHCEKEEEGWRRRPSAQHLQPAAPAAAAAPRPAAAAARGEWQVEETPGVWRPLPAEVGDQLLSAYYAGESRALYVSVGVSYEVDFGLCVRTNRRTNAQQRVRWGAAQAPAPGEAAVDAGQAAAPAPHGAGQLSGMYETRYQWEMKNGAWADYDDEEQQYLLAAWMMGKNSVRYSARGFEYEIDFFMMRQTNATLGQVRQVRVKPRQAWEPPAPACEPPRRPSSEATLDDGQAAAASADAPPPGDAGAAAARPAAKRPAAAARRPKKYSLGRGGQAAAPEPQPQGPPPQGPPPQGPPPQGPGAEPKAAPSRPAGPASTDLPAGAAWPGDAAARSAAAALFAELAALKGSPLESRRGAYKSKCLAWHPDKNLDREDLATEVFQFLQSLRSWYFEG